MPRIIIIALLFLSFGCLDRPSPTQKAYEIAQYLKKGQLDLVEQSFYSQEYYASINNASEIFKQFEQLISKLEVDKVENISIDSFALNLNNPLLPPDTSIVYNCIVQLGVEMPSMVPHYLLLLSFIDKENEWKLVGCDLRSTQMPNTNNTLEIEEEIFINKAELVMASLMFEGGYKEPLIFKRNEILPNGQSIYADKLDSLISFINEAEIIKSQKENDTRRFVGDPQMGIISLEVSNQFKWTIFSLISEQQGKEENFYGDLELRYGQYLNHAVTYWIKTQNPQATKRLMLELCHSGANTRTRPKESVKLELEKN